MKHFLTKQARYMCWLAARVRKEVSGSNSQTSCETESGEGSLFDRNEMAEEPREKRERKATVEVYSVASPTKKEFVIPEGAGTKVGDIPNGAFHPRPTSSFSKSRLLAWRSKAIRPGSSLLTPPYFVPAHPRSGVRPRQVQVGR
jgi:hypothetical protein